MPRVLRLLILTNDLRLGNIIGLVWANYLVTRTACLFRYGTDREYFAKLNLVLKGVPIEETTYMNLYVPSLKVSMEIYITRMVAGNPSSLLTSYLERFNSYAIILTEDESYSLRFTLRAIIKAKKPRWIPFFLCKISAPLAIIIFSKNEDKIKVITNSIRKLIKKMSNFALFHLSDEIFLVNNGYMLNLDNRKIFGKLSEPFKWILHMKLKKVI